MALRPVSHLVAVLFSGAALAARLWPYPGALPTIIPAGCRASLSMNITCPSPLLKAHELMIDAPLGDEFLTGYCTSECTESFKTWSNTVHTRCGSEIYDFGNGTMQSGDDIALPLAWAQKVSCLKDSKSGEFCQPLVTSHTAGACDDCTLKYLAGMLNSTYGHAKINAEAFLSLLSSCDASPTEYPHSTLTTVPPTATQTTDPSLRCMGDQYVVQEGDSCESIAADNNLAIDRFLSDNSIDFYCNSLIVGSSVCVGDSCALHTVEQGETCKDILVGKTFTITELLSWNPIIYRSCENLADLVGRTICISPPGSDDWDIPISVSLEQSFTLPPGSWIPAPTAGEDYNSTTSHGWYDFDPIPTSTATANITGINEEMARITNCPITNEDKAAGFIWEWLPADCKESLQPYCSPPFTGPIPSSTTFPSSCMPSEIMDGILG